MPPVKKDNHGKILTIVFVVTFIAAIVASFWRYYYTKNYDYLVEASCDPMMETCFVRDCENPDDCPPNQLSVYKQFTVKAYDFPKCSDNSCKTQCESETIQCVLIVCDVEAGDECSEPQETDTVVESLLEEVEE